MKLATCTMFQNHVSHGIVRFEEEIGIEDSERSNVYNYAMYCTNINIRIHSDDCWAATTKPAIANFQKREHNFTSKIKTVEDCWAAISKPPKRPRMYSSYVRLSRRHAAVATQGPATCITSTALISAKLSPLEIQDHVSQQHWKSSKIQ